MTLADLQSIYLSSVLQVPERVLQFRVTWEDDKVSRLALIV